MLQARYSGILLRNSRYGIPLDLHSILKKMRTHEPAANIIDLYERHAHHWDADRGKDLFEKPWLDRFLALLPASGTVLDIGCGSGEPIGRYVIEQGFTLTGVDSSRSLVEICRARFPENCWAQADMRTLALMRRFDGLLAWNSFFHLRPADQRRMFDVFAAHASPGSALMFTSGPSNGEIVGNYRGEPLYHGSLDPDEYRSLLARSGFSLVDNVIQDASCGHHTIWMAQYTGKADHDDLADFTHQPTTAD